MRCRKWKSQTLVPTTPQPTHKRGKTPRVASPVPRTVDEPSKWAKESYKKKSTRCPKSVCGPSFFLFALNCVHKRGDSFLVSAPSKRTKQRSTDTFGACLWFLPRLSFAHFGRSSTAGGIDGFFLLCLGAFASHDWHGPQRGTSLFVGATGACVGALVAHGHQWHDMDKQRRASLFPSPLMNRGCH
nr:hypothetical protein [Pandoravirus massiliensis]